MAVHMYRVYLGTGTEGMDLLTANSVVGTWTDENAEWAEDPVKHTLSETAYPDGSGGEVAVYQGDFRFLLEDAKTDLIRKLTDTLDNKVPWYRYLYHNCSHDEQDPTPCDWDDKGEWAATSEMIPAAVPDPSVQ
jgi:hypothetical protein